MWDFVLVTLGLCVRILSMRRFTFFLFNTSLHMGHFLWITGCSHEEVGVGMVAVVVGGRAGCLSLQKDKCLMKSALRDSIDWTGSRYSGSATVVDSLTHS